MLHLHYGLGFLVFLAAIAAIFFAPARRIVLYLLVLQIIVGVITAISLHIAPPVLHWLLAILVGGLYAMAAAFERRGRPRSTVLATLVIAALVIAAVFSIGMRAVGT